MNDLIYCNSQEDYDEIKKVILDKFPTINIEDASDFVHEYRFSVNSEEVKSDDFFEFIIEKGFGILSLVIGLMIHQDQKRLRKLIERVEKKK